MPSLQLRGAESSRMPSRRVSRSTGMTAVTGMSIHPASAVSVPALWWTLTVVMVTEIEV